MTDLKLDDFGRLKALYPNGMRYFTDWIDAYKESVGWKALFNSDSNWQDANGKNAPAPKYHELPGAMQTGIFIQFMDERGGCSYMVDLFEFDLLEELNGVMPMLEDEHREKYNLCPQLIGVELVEQKPVEPPLYLLGFPTTDEMPEIKPIAGMASPKLVLPSGMSVDTKPMTPAEEFDYAGTARKLWNNAGVPEKFHDGSNPDNGKSKEWDEWVRGKLLNDNGRESEQKDDIQGH